MVDVKLSSGELPRRRGASVWMVDIHRANGKTYSPFVRHILLTDDPAVKGQGPPIRLRQSPLVRTKESPMCTTMLKSSLAHELRRNAQLRAQHEADRTLAAIGQGPLAGQQRGVRLAAPPAPRESTDPEYLETKEAAIKLIAELGVDIEELPDATKEDLDWALRNFPWTPTNPQVSSPPYLGRYALNAIFDSLVRVKAEEAKQGSAAIDISEHSNAAALRAGPCESAVEHELRRNRALRAKMEAKKTLAAAGYV